MAGTCTREPAIVFLHGSSGLGLKAIGEWQRWLAGLGYASLAPDSFALPGRITYTSPISKSDYERLHAMRASEIAPALTALQAQPWVDARRLVLAGASEGAVPVARYAGAGFSARLVYAWSCEDNYFVQSAQNAFSASQPALNVISAVDPYFSAANSWLGLASPKGHCGAALAGHARSAVVLVPDAPHTLLNMPAAKSATAGFLQLLFSSHDR
jgi:dienelactone hydrolase